MDEAFVKSRYTRNGGSYRRRRKNSNSKDLSKAYDKIMRKAAVLIILVVIIAIAANINTPATNYVSNKVKAVLSNDTDVKGIFEDADIFLKKLMGKDAEKKENTQVEPLVATIAEINTDDDYGSESIDYGGGVEEGEEAGENIVEYSDLDLDSIPDTEIPQSEDIQDAENLTKPDDSNTKKTGNNEKKTTETKVSMAVPVFGRVSSGYGSRIHPLKNTTDYHHGVDIAANSGTSIKAALAGEVIEAQKDASFGNYIKIQHENGLQTLYAHCSALLVKKGQKVKKGEVIARVGSTGNSNGPHLHFEVRKGGKTINPLSYITLPLK
ncbi:MAG: M23 family metallopeptidase [Clostridia bacterium]|nr:M23 family metallopeptidase [Clostridia bacterium]